MSQITAKRRECLQWYRDRELVPSPEGRVMSGDERWDGREMRWALDAGLLICGPNGWHVLSFAGLEALEAARAAGKADV